MEQRQLKLAIGGMVFAALFAAPAGASTRTWVSGNGNDADPCSFTAPCKTFAGAFAKTDAGGEISVMGPGGYGTVTINKSLTINGVGSLASILVASGSGIIVSAGATDKVVIRNVQFNGTSGGNSGVQVISGNVTIDNCGFYGFTAGFFGGMGVLINANSTTVVDIRDTNISYSTHGVWAQTTSGFAVASLDNVRINGSLGYGVIAASNGFVNVNRSYISNSAVTAVYTASTGSTINVNDSVLTNNATAVNASASGSTIRLNSVSLFDNTTALATGAGATIATANNNKAAGNGGALTTNGTVSNF
ncbi:MAG: hypothetical protein E6G97_19895 [Alphaproteobacteria bacterium]|nr:MAG: hypothetical protein E6G97_19895 [Alphaproteobacteria bacterium]